jgi:hypothetical protein
MASIKTIVRELGVVYWLDRIIEDEVIKPENVSPEEFLDVCDRHIGDEIRNASKIEGRDSFSKNKTEILRNTFWLSKRLINVLEIDSLDNISWIGPETQRNYPIDLEINGELVSLKEDSYILENMGLYQYINIMTDSDYNQGSWHIFKDFADEKYQEWFDVSWNMLIKEAQRSDKQLIWKDDSKDYNRRIEVDNSSIKLIYKDRESQLPKKTISIDSYTEKTISKTREVFGKWLNDYFLPEESTEDQKNNYRLAKRNCALKAANNLIDYVQENKDIKYSNLLRLLQVYDKSYIYAKSAGGTSKIYKVESLDDYNYSRLDITDISKDIPESQVNIITTIKNRETGKNLKLRNEVRFSHRQFNGTPEAKLYLVENQSLSTVYEEIDKFNFKGKEIGENTSQLTL